MSGLTTVLFGDINRRLLNNRNVCCLSWNLTCLNIKEYLMNCRTGHNATLGVSWFGSDMALRVLSGYARIILTDTSKATVLRGALQSDCLKCRDGGICYNLIMRLCIKCNFSSTHKHHHHSKSPYERRANVRLNEVTEWSCTPCLMCHAVVHTCAAKLTWLCLPSLLMKDT